MRLGEAASESTLAADSSAASFGRSAAGSDLPPRFLGIATWPRKGASVARSAGLRGPAGATPRTLDEAEKASSPQSEAEGFASEVEGCRAEGHRVPYMKKLIDRFRFEEYGGVVRSRSRLKENRGLASVDRIAGCVTCVQGWCRWGRANDSRSEGQDWPTSRTWRGRSSRTRELPKCARSTRGVLSSSGQWCGLIRSGCEPVHRGCLRFSSKTLSRTREPLAVGVIAQRLGGYPQRHSSHHQGLPRRRPGGRPPPR